MNSELENRVRAAVRAIADEPAVVVPAVPPRPRVRRQISAWLVPVTAAVGVLVMVMLTTLVPRLSGGPDTSAPPGVNVFLPKRFAGLSLLTAKLSDAPLRQPGIAVVNLGNLGTTWGSNQVVLVGADGRTYRRVDVAEQRGTLAADGEWSHAQAKLSPDGRLLAIGDERGGATSIVVLDLVTGERHDYPLDPPAAYYLTTWSADSRTLAVVLRDSRERTPEPFGTAAEGDRLGLLDTANGSLSTIPVPHLDYSQPMAFSGDGERLAVGTEDGDNWHSEIIELDTTTPVGPQLPVPPGFAFAGWTSDTRTLLVQADVLLRAVDATDGRQLAPDVRLPGVPRGILAWRGPATVLVRVEPADGSKGGRLVEVDYLTGSVRTISTYDESLLGRFNSVSVASGLAAYAGVTGGAVRRGPWPDWARIVFAVVVVVGGLLGYLVIRRAVRTEAPARRVYTNRVID